MCTIERSKHAVREDARYAPAPVRRTVRPSSSPYTPYACGAQRALLPVVVGAINIHDVRDRQTTDVRRASSLNVSAY